MNDVIGHYLRANWLLYFFGMLILFVSIFLSYRLDHSRIFFTSPPDSSGGVYSWSARTVVKSPQMSGSEGFRNPIAEEHGRKLTLDYIHWNFNGIHLLTLGPCCGETGFTGTAVGFTEWSFSVFEPMLQRQLIVTSSRDLSTLPFYKCPWHLVHIFPLPSDGQVGNYHR